MKKNSNNGFPQRGQNAMPFLTEARKYNHWAIGGLLELGGNLVANYGYNSFI